MDAATGCPDTYEELFLTYYPMLREIVARAGIASDDVRDVAMDLLTRFMERDGIAWYDPQYLHDTGESPDLPGDRYRTAKFKAMLRSWASKSVLSFRDKQMVRHRREPWRLEATWTAAGPDRTWAEHEDYAAEPLADVEVSVVIVHALQRSRRILVGRSTKKRDYARFIDLALQHGLLDGRLDRKALQEALDVSPSTLTQMLNELRGILRPMLTDAGIMPEAKVAVLPTPVTPLIAAVS